MKTAITSSIIEFIDNEILGGQGSELNDSTPLLEYGILDSFALLSLISFLSEKYGVDFDLMKVAPADFETVASIASIVECQVKGNPSAC